MPSHAHFIMSGGKGPPQDLLDVNCQMLRNCYSCAQIEDQNCDAHNSTYSYDLRKAYLEQHEIIFKLRYKST